MNKSVREEILKKNNCEHCRWHDDFSWACSNGDSPYCADFTDNEQSCPAFEAKGDIDD